MTDNVTQIHQPLTQDDWNFIFNVLEGTKLDVPRIRSEIARLRQAAGAGESADANDDWCSEYHCTGDCGLRGNGYQHRMPLVPNEQ